MPKLGGGRNRRLKARHFWLGCRAVGLEMGESLAAKLERLPIRGKNAGVAAWPPDAADHGDWYALRLCFGLEGGRACLGHRRHDFVVVSCREQRCKEPRLALKRFLRGRRERHAASLDQSPGMGGASKL